MAVKEVFIIYLLLSYPLVDAYEAAVHAAKHKQAAAGKNADAKGSELAPLTQGSTKVCRHPQGCSADPDSHALLQGKIHAHLDSMDDQIDTEVELSCGHDYELQGAPTPDSTNGYTYCEGGHQTTRPISTGGAKGLAECKAYCDKDDFCHYYAVYGARPCVGGKCSSTSCIQVETCPRQVQMTNSDYQGTVGVVYCRKKESCGRGYKLQGAPTPDSTKGYTYCEGGQSTTRPMSTGGAKGLAECKGYCDRDDFCHYYAVYGAKPCVGGKCSVTSCILVQTCPKKVQMNDADYQGTVGVMYCKKEATCDMFTCGGTTPINKGSSVKCPGGVNSCRSWDCCEAAPKTKEECLAEKKCFAEAEQQISTGKFRNTDGTPIKLATFVKDCFLCNANEAPNDPCTHYKNCIASKRLQLDDKSLRLILNLDAVQGYLKREVTSDLQLTAEAQAADSTECQDPSSDEWIRKVRNNCDCLYDLHEACDGSEEAGEDQQTCLRKRACNHPTVCSTWKIGKTFGRPNCPQALLENSSTGAMLERSDTLDESLTTKKTCR